MTTTPNTERLGFLDELRQQRWDDHRLYHHSRVNQSLHLLSALCFLSAYVLIWSDLTAAVLIGWLLAMVSRQTGHFIFEPKGFDQHSGLDHAQREAIKVGYNLRRKVLLLSAWVSAPLALLAWPSFFGLLTPASDGAGYLHNMCVLWLSLGVLAVIGRTVQLFVISSVQAGLVWMTKILTDPFHDVLIYWRSPWLLLRGERLDPMVPWPGVRGGQPG